MCIVARVKNLACDLNPRSIFKVALARVFLVFIVIPSQLCVNRTTLSQSSAPVRIDFILYCLHNVQGWVMHNRPFQLRVWYSWNAN